MRYMLANKAGSRTTWNIFVPHMPTFEGHCLYIVNVENLKSAKCWRKKFKSLNEHRISIDPSRLCRNYGHLVIWLKFWMHSNVHYELSHHTILISDYGQFNHALHFNHSIHSLKSHIIISEINWMSIDASPNMRMVNAI